MFPLDTNVVSGLSRPSPDPTVETRIEHHPAADLYLSVSGEAELRYGVAIMSPGRLRAAVPGWGHGRRSTWRHSGQSEGMNGPLKPALDAA